MSECLTCQLVARRDAGTAPLWDSIHRTGGFDIAHAYNTSLPGWIVIVARRHLAAVSDLSDEEAAELGSLIHSVSIGLKATVGCIKTYVMQFAESDGHNHVHFHIVPRMADLPDDCKGANIFRCLGVEDALRVPESEMNRIGQELRRHIT